ncbi:glycosyltransferase [Paenibacillus mendelii]|uniref:Glycosyltransferase n=1 Tax=Paenibacillus mendelii TaxID=206163 RepID=A0ABV6J912_9BACL|nr:glycosyltransferase [Paenibacillus mendelii]MCQ6559713.1 glycosyltransferase [Paenibacillus mendelii]
MSKEKLKILYFGVDQTNWVKENWEYFNAELNKMPNLQVAYFREGGAIHDIIRQIGFTPDFIFFGDFKKTRTISVTGLDQVSIPKGVLAIDLQSSPDIFRKFVKKNKINLIFSVYRDAFFRFFPEFAKKFVWLPHHVYTPVFKDYKLPKEIDYLLMGAVGKDLYPVRTKILHRMKGTRGFVYHKHPGYKYFSEQERKKALIGKNFAREINHSKLFFTDDSKYRYPISKYYEVAACNTLVVGTGSRELNDLGFIHRKTFVEIDKHNFKDRAKYYLKREKRREEIARRGYEMVRTHHATSIRARQFVDCIRRYLGWKRKLDPNSNRPIWMRLHDEMPS